MLIKINGTADDINSELLVCIDLAVMHLALTMVYGGSKEFQKKKITVVSLFIYSSAKELFEPNKIYMVAGNMSIRCV